MDSDPFEGLDYVEVYESVTRMRRALEPKYKPIDLNIETQSAYFKGSAKTPYFTTLESCTCPDWAISGADPDKPCKHMYRLAHELHKCDLYKLIPARSMEDVGIQIECSGTLHALARYWEFIPDEEFIKNLIKVIKLRIGSNKALEHLFSLELTKHD